VGDVPDVNHGTAPEYGINVLTLGAQALHTDSDDPRFVKFLTGVGK
jgi:hypothetical protein